MCTTNITPLTGWGCSRSFYSFKLQEDKNKYIITTLNTLRQNVKDQRKYARVAVQTMTIVIKRLYNCDTVHSMVPVIVCLQILCSNLFMAMPFRGQSTARPLCGMMFRAAFLFSNSYGSKFSIWFKHSEDSTGRSWWVCWHTQNLASLLLAVDTKILSETEWLNQHLTTK